MVETLATLVPNAGALNLAVLEALDQLGLGVLVKNMGTGRYEVSNASAARILPHAGADSRVGLHAGLAGHARRALHTQVVIRVRATTQAKQARARRDQNDPLTIRAHTRGRLRIRKTPAHALPFVPEPDEKRDREAPDDPDRPDHAHDSRWIHRPAMDWAVAAGRETLC